MSEKNEFKVCLKDAINFTSMLNRHGILWDGDYTTEGCTVTVLDQLDKALEVWEEYQGVKFKPTTEATIQLTERQFNYITDHSLERVIKTAISKTKDASLKQDLEDVLEHMVPVMYAITANIGFVDQVVIKK